MSRSIVGANLRFWREERRWTLQELADRMGLSRAAVTQMELGTQAIKDDHLLRFATVLQVPLERFFEPPPIKHSGELDQLS